MITYNDLINDTDSPVPLCMCEFFGSDLEGFHTFFYAK